MGLAAQFSLRNRSSDLVVLPVTVHHVALDMLAV